MLQMFADIAGLALVKAQLYEENLRLDRVDRETGLEKYVPFLERLRAGMDRAEEFSENFAVIILDIDNFKNTVNTYGYDTSRVLLKEMGTLVKASLRPVDAAGRYGFDEFIVMLANTGLEGAIEFANRLRLLIAAQHFTQHTLTSTVSIGVAAFPRNGTSPDALILTAKERPLRGTAVGQEYGLQLQKANGMPRRRNGQAPETILCPNFPICSTYSGTSSATSSTAGSPM